MPRLITSSLFADGEVALFPTQRKESNNRKEQQSNRVLHGKEQGRSQNIQYPGASTGTGYNRKMIEITRVRTTNPGTWNYYKKK